MWIYQNKDDSHEPTTFSRTAGHVTTHISPISQPRTHTSSQQCHSPTHWWGQTVVVSPPLPHKIYIIRRAWAHRVTQNATIPDKKKSHEICKRRILKIRLVKCQYNDDDTISHKIQQSSLPQSIWKTTTILITTINLNEFVCAAKWHLSTVAQGPARLKSNCTLHHGHQ